MELRDYLNVVRARKWVIIQAVVIVTLVAVVVSVIQAPSYESEARVLISEKDTGSALLGMSLSEFSQPERGLQTQVQLMQVRPLLENTVRKLGLGITPDQLAGRVNISGVGQTNIVSIKATSGDAQTAADIANTLAEEFVAWSRGYKRESIQSAISEVEMRLEESKAEILELGRRINDEGKSDDLSAELSIATGAYTTLAAQLEQLKINEQLEVGSGRVVSPAVVTEEPVAPSPKRNGALGLAVGLVFGLGMAFLYEYLDDTIKSSAELEELNGAPVLGLIPAEKYEKNEKRRLTLVQAPGSPAAEAYRVLRNSLDFVNFEHDIKTLLVTSAAPAEGKSTVAANLAVGLAQAGKKVAFVNCDFRRPTTDQFFAVNNMIGLAEVLAGSNTLKAGLQRPMEDVNLLVLAAGKLPPNPSELLGSRKMEELLTNLEEWADWVIIDSPPLLAVADGAAVARWVDGVLLVSKGGQSTREAARKARELLENVGARISGVVVWGLEGGASGGGYGYHGYGTYGGYYYYSDYYANLPADGTRTARGGKSAKPPQAGARAAEIPAAGAVYVPPVSPARKFAMNVGRVLAGILAFLVVVVIVLLCLYFLDQAFGWGIIPSAVAPIGMG